MKTILAIILLIFCTPLVAQNSILKELDKAILNRHIFHKIKEEKIDSLRLLLQKSSIANKKDLYQSLFDEYLPFSSDSAYSYAVRQQQIAKQSDNKIWITKADINIALSMNAMGMYREAIITIDKISECPDQLKYDYYSAYRTIYGAMSDYVTTDEHRNMYKEITAAYRDSMLLTSTDSATIKIILADKYIVDKQYDKAIEIISPIYIPNRFDRLNAIVSYSLSEAYGCKGDHDKEMDLLAESAIADLQTSVKEYISLWKLAIMLHQKGDTQRAYQYLKCSLEDATQSKSRLRTNTISTIYPIIEKSYLQMESAQKTKNRILFIVISALSIALAIAVAYVSRQMVKLSAIKNKLSQTNSQITNTNKQLAQINKIKEEYIGRYFGQCSYYISEIEKYQRKINKSKNDATTENEQNYSKNFYNDFDHAFLNIFPTFVDDFNNLLLPEHRILLKSNELMNTELRIFALIRLGIDNSEQIAKLLRYSTSTIYNYRTKMRNYAACQRNEFEQKVSQIGV